jgi:FixJ family two-component response regulator
MSGMELQRRLVEQGIDIPIIFLTGHGDIPLASEAFRTGAFDFLEKPFAVDTLLQRIHQALAREAELWRARCRRKTLRESYAQLSQREKQVLKWVSAGYSSKEIASAMGISSRTVDVHRAHVMEKMRAKSLADLIALAMELEAAEQG